jgi:GTP-binding protein EngB required for normal cell division
MQKLETEIIDNESIINDLLKVADGNHIDKNLSSSMVQKLKSMRTKWEQILTKKDDRKVKSNYKFSRYKNVSM